MWATTISSATSTSGGRSATSSSRIPRGEEDLAPELAPAARAGQRPHPPRVRHRDDDQEQRRARVDHRVHQASNASEGAARYEPAGCGLKKRRCSADDGDRHHRQRDPVAPGLVELGHVGEVHPPDRGEEGRHGDDRRPGGDRAHDLVLLHAEQRQVRLEDRGQQLALRGHLLVDAAGVVGDVAEVAAQLLVHVRERAALERLERREQRRRSRGGTRSPRA